MLERVWAVYFSPCGNVKKTVLAMAEAAAQTLGLALSEADITLPEARERDYGFGPGDLVFAGTPVYAGRVPNKLAPYLIRALHGNGAAGVPVVCFGNRSFDDALAELAHILGQNGFAIPAAAAVVSGHSFSDKLAPGRPNERDMERIRAFGSEAAVRARIGDFETPAIPGGEPPWVYYTPLGTDGLPAKFLKAVPETDAGLCDGCGVCARACPMGSIPPESPAETRGVCIKCHACVHICPRHARRFTDPAFLSHRAMLEENYQRPVPSLFL